MHQASHKKANCWSPPRWSSYSQSLFRIVIQNNATFLVFMQLLKTRKVSEPVARWLRAQHDFALPAVSKNTCTSSLYLFAFHTASSLGRVPGQAAAWEIASQRASSVEEAGSGFQKVLLRRGQRGVRLNKHRTFRTQEVSALPRCT